MKDPILIDGLECDLRDVMNPPGMFLGGKRQRDYSTTSDLLPLSGKLIPEFFGRRNIRDMFARKPSLPHSQSNRVLSTETKIPSVTTASQRSSMIQMLSSINGNAEGSREITTAEPTSFHSAAGRKRSAPAATGGKSIKRGKSVSATAMLPTGKGQQSLRGFFKPNATLDSSGACAIQGGEWSEASPSDNTASRASVPAADLTETRLAPDMHMEVASLDSAIHTPGKVDVQHVPGESPSANDSPEGNHRAVIQRQKNVHDPVESKESWSKLFTKPTAPRCEGHDEPCISLLTKKPGVNLGRSFWMCPRPLGPSGAKEKNTQWRCQTFIWCSDWNSNVTNG